LPLRKEFSGGIGLNVGLRLVDLLLSINKAGVKAQKGKKLFHLSVG
jgi:hypothetical protein